MSSDWTLALATVRASDLTGNAASDWWIRRPPGLAETQRSALIGRARMAPLSASNHSRAKERRHGPTDRTVRYRRWFFSRFFFRRRRRRRRRRGGLERRRVGWRAPTIAVDSPESFGLDLGRRNPAPHPSTCTASNRISFFFQ